MNNIFDDIPNFTLLATLLNPKLEVIECAKHSRIKQDLQGEGFLELLELKLSEEELETIKLEQKRKIEVKEHQFKIHKSKPLEEHFDTDTDSISRNFAIMNAIDDGYTQASIATFLKLSPSTISKIIRLMKEE